MMGPSSSGGSSRISTADGGSKPASTLRPTTTAAAASSTMITRLGMSSTDGNIESVSLPARMNTVGKEKPQPEIHPDNPYLYKIPEGLHRYYRPLPLVAQTMTFLMATWLAAVTTWKKLTWWRPLAIARGLRSTPSLLEFLSFLFKAVTYALVAQTLLQEVFKRPSRISIQTLLERYFLPSKLSKYRTITVPGTEKDEPPFSLGVHYLECNNQEVVPNTSVDPAVNTTRAVSLRFDALYLQHGFGASSLSWLPAVPALVRLLDAGVGLGHDAVGFGFTERPQDKKWYTSKQSARIARQILLQAINDNRTANLASSSNIRSNDSPPKAVALMGHSLGCLAMLRLATELPKETAKFIILSSPALGIHNRKVPRSSNKNDDNNQSWLRRKAFSPFGRFAQQRLLLPVGRYVLKRVVGTKGSWKSGLKLAWGDPTKVTDGDVLRFSWPAVGMGWEDGILRFASAQSLPQEDELDNDRILMQRVLDLPNTKVAIILGSSDKVVSPKQAYKFMENFEAKDAVPIIELEGLGHDAFEEDTDAFCRVVNELLQSHWSE